MAKTVLVTGGAGFIGSHLVDELLARGHRVRVLDDLSPQVHGEARIRPAYLSSEAELIIADIRDRATLEQAIAGVDVVYHFAARVGVGQSMYQVEDYVSVNTSGTSTLLEVMMERPVERLIVASSMSVYGEGLYRASNGQLFDNVVRSKATMDLGQWDPVDERGEPLTAISTPESKRCHLESVYALTKFDQERLALIFGRVYRIPTVALRFFNVYGPRQALSNPYTGVLAIFASRILNDRRPMIFEDGLQRRDFVSVKDVVRACGLAMEEPHADGHVFNIGSGQSQSILSLAEKVAQVLGRPSLSPHVTRRHRAGDIRHCFADIRLAEKVLGYRPEVSLEAGLEDLAAWLESQVAVDRLEDADLELTRRGLAIEARNDARGDARSEAKPSGAGRPDSLRPGTGDLASEARSEAKPSGAGRPDSLRPGTGDLAS